MPRSLFVLFLLSLLSCSSPPVAPEGESMTMVDANDTDRTPAENKDDLLLAPPPPWVLTGLGKESYRITSSPSPSCLQNYINKNSGNPKAKPNPNLAKWILAGASSAKIDTYVLAALIHQETGDFISKTGVNGVGLTQMTGNTIADACLALEGSDCKNPLANPKHLESWEAIYQTSVAKLYGRSDFRNYYPWHKACSNFVSRCERDCGISDACMSNMRKLIYTDSRMSILLGTFTLVNKLAEARRDNPNANIRALYRVGLRLYNGHPKYKVEYVKKIMDERMPKILKACPPSAK